MGSGYENKNLTVHRNTHLENSQQHYLNAMNPHSIDDLAQALRQVVPFVRIVGDKRLS